MSYLYAAVFTDEERRQIVAAFQLFISKLVAPQIEAFPQTPAPRLRPAPTVPQGQADRAGAGARENSVWPEHT